MIGLHAYRREHEVSLPTAPKDSAADQANMMCKRSDHQGYFGRIARFRLMAVGETSCWERSALPMTGEQRRRLRSTFGRTSGCHSWHRQARVRHSFQTIDNWTCAELLRVDLFSPV
jgi:hypothetical protein